MNAITYSLSQPENLKHFLFFTFLTISFALAPSYTAASGDPSGGGLIRVESKYICMINNERFKKVQTPVIVDGKTYYGCCRMCEQTLNKDPQSHFAMDPVSGRSVDKATAVIGVSPDGSAFYFENEANMNSYTPPVKR